MNNTSNDAVNIQAQEYGYRADITLFDAGRGFPAEKASAVCLPFWQADPNSPGLGLGLYLAKEFIEGSRGSISLSSQPNRGTLVKISLRLRA